MDAESDGAAIANHITSEQRKARLLLAMTIGKPGA
jgi:hypothetical protein